MYRIGVGYDSHRFADNRKLFLGGVEIPYEKGLLGHSDADVLLHAVSDALLGAANLGDIGELFPDTDDKYKNVSSVVLLEKVVELVREKWDIVNIDNVIVAQFPKLSPYKKKMVNKIAEILELSTDCVSIKASTNEKMGFVGRGEGIAVISNVLLRRK